MPGTKTCTGTNKKTSRKEGKIRRKHCPVCPNIEREIRELQVFFK